MGAGSNTLIIYTKSYPYGVGEAFLHNEVKFLCNKFEKIFLVPFTTPAGPARSLPANVEIIQPVAEMPAKTSLFFRVFFMSLGEKKRAKHLSHFRYVLSYYRNALKYQRHLLEFYKKHPGAIHYTYWFEEWALYLADLKKRKIIGSFISRAHGYDLFESRWMFGFIPSRTMQLKQVNKLVFASDDAHDQIAKEQPAFRNKFTVSKIGTYDNGTGPVSTGDRFVLVSCSNLLPIKRVERIVETLMQVNFPVHWIHFGDGSLMEKIKTKAAGLPSHVQYELKGSIDNMALMEFYKTNAVDAMILLSETEGGVPVSLQEAASFGIPLIGAKAGGIPEIVNETTGILVSENATVDETLEALQTLRENDRSRNGTYRSAVRTYWNSHYNALNSFERFYTILSVI